jgi:hypothetical protein
MPGGSNGMPGGGGGIPDIIVKVRVGLGHGRLEISSPKLWRRKGKSAFGRSSPIMPAFKYAQQQLKG